MLSKCTPLEYPLLNDTDPLAVRLPPVGKEKASTSAIQCGAIEGMREKASANQRPSHHGVWRVLSSAIGDPYKLRCTSTSGSVLGVSVVTDTSDWCSCGHSNCIDTQVHRAGGFLKGLAAAYCSKCVCLFHSLIRLACYFLRWVVSLSTLFLQEFIMSTFPASGG